MARFSIFQTYTKQLAIEADTLKEVFPDDWGYALADGLDEESFVRSLVEEYGIDGIEESLPDGPFSWVDSELSIINE